MIAVPAELDEGALPIGAEEQMGAVHGRHRHLAMQRMVVLRTGGSVAQQARMIGEGAVGLEDRGARAGAVEAIAHRQAAPVEFGVPDHLAEVGQDRHGAPRIRQPQRLDARGIAEGRGGEARAAGDGALAPVGKGVAGQGDVDLGHFRDLR
ncbi:hypothetical protein DWF04_021660 [Cereibacter sphaeroides f. sp. denitrificans]